MAKIVVFDSGFGSLSIIKAIQNVSKSEIIYFADQKNFPYGKKSKRELKKIIIKNIEFLKKKFNPDLIVLGSNTPSLLLKDLKQNSIIYVVPPIKEASILTKSFSIGILATKSVVNSKELKDYIQQQRVAKKIKITKINASPLVSLVESGNFITNTSLCRKKIKEILSPVFDKNNIDVAILSSTHLPFLLKILQEEFPKVKFIDPAAKIAQKVAKKIKNSKSHSNTMKIFTSADPIIFQKKLRKIGIQDNVKRLTFV